MEDDSRCGLEARRAGNSLTSPAFVHLHTHSWFSFLRGASSPETLANRAAALGQEALALTDDWTLAGVVQHARACNKAGIAPVFGARITVNGIGLVLLCANDEGYANLCDLLTLAHRERLRPRLAPEDLQGHSAGLFCLADVSAWLRADKHHVAWSALQRLLPWFGSRLSVELVHHRRAGDSVMVQETVALAESLGLPVAATNAVRHAVREEYVLLDALTCARYGLTVEDGHPDRPQNEAAFLCGSRYFEGLNIPPRAFANALAIARECCVDLLSPEVVPPAAEVPDGFAASPYLQRLCNEGFRRRFPLGNARAVPILRKELATISALGLDEFFLVVREVVDFARGRGIRCCGRGSAANSLVAYLLGITEVDPICHNLLFERFLHEGRKGMPDIDVDFETHRRAEVIRWMGQRFGEEQTAMTANVVTFRLRMAVREMAKVLGFPLSLIDRAGKLLPHASAYHVREYRKELALTLGGGQESPAIDVLCTLVERLHGCPRHLGLHSGGMILSRRPLRHLSPIQISANGVRQVQFAKDDVESLGLIKFDVLGLRMLSVVSEAASLIEDCQRRNGEKNSTAVEESTVEFDRTPFNRTFVDRLPADDPPTYDLIRSGQTLGVFQIESPGQWNLLARSQPENFDDLVAQVALFRPGPLQGNMVHPYVARRRGLARVMYPHPSLEPVLRDTYGIILFQEQVLEVAHRFAGMNLSEADEFRRLMSKFRNPGEMEAMRAKFVASAVSTHAGTKHPVYAALAHRVFDIVAKFVGYGFCRSHAAAFARTVYQSAYLKAHFPAAYMAGVLEHKPGFYPMHTLLEEARRLGVKVLPPCFLRSGVKYGLEVQNDATQAIRVPLTQIQEVAVESAQSIILARALAPFTSLQDAVERLNLGRDEWENLARSGALACWGERRNVLWQVRVALRSKPSGEQMRLEFDRTADEPRLAQLRPAEVTTWDFATQGLTTGPHPIALHRPDLDRLGASTIHDLRECKSGSRALVAGTVISRQRPPTAKGMCFLILEDETGRLPTAVTPPVYEKFRHILRAPALLIEGQLEDAGVSSGNDYRSVLIYRMWSLDSVCGAVVGGVSGHPGEHPRTAASVS
jgi:error-prone DNA polymerase